MSVNIIWSLTNGGTSISSALDFGNASNGANTGAQDIYLRHDGDNEITAVGLYIRQFSGSYSGSFTSANDIAELLGWGDSSSSDDFGGVQFNLDATGSFGSGSWPTVSSKSPTNGFVARTGVGDSESNAVTLTTNTGCSSAGVIPSSSSPNVRFRSRIQVPTNEDTLGIRQFEIVAKYNYTS